MNSSIADDRAIEISRKALDAGDKNFARQMLAKVLSRNPQITEGWVLMARALDSETQQMDCWRRVIALEPNHPEALKALGKPASTGNVPLRVKEVEITEEIPAGIPKNYYSPQETIENNQADRISAESEMEKDTKRNNYPVATRRPRLGTAVLVLLGVGLLGSLGMWVGGSLWLFSAFSTYQSLMTRGQMVQLALLLAAPLSLAIFGFIGVILTSLGLYNSIAGQQDAWELNRSKNVVDALVVDTWIESTRKSGGVTAYWVAYMFEVGLSTGGIEKFVIKEPVSELVFVKLHIGSSLPVRIILENPKICRLNFQTF